MDQTPKKTQVQNRVLRLFTYLEQSLALDDTLLRDFRLKAVAPSPWWLADLPKDIDSLYIRSFVTNTDTQQELESSVWLRVQKKDIDPAPQLPTKLQEWIEEIIPLQPPKPKESIDRQVFFTDKKARVQEFASFMQVYKEGDLIPQILQDWLVISPDKEPSVIEERLIPDYWIDHDELSRMLKVYEETAWKPWAEKINKLYAANMLYDQLYALRLLLKNEGDNYEFLLGQGLLTWNKETGEHICAPIFLTPLIIDFDPAKRIIELSPDPLVKGFSEISSVYGLDNPAEIDLVTWSDTTNSNPFDFWQLESLKMQCQILGNYISQDSEDHFTDTMVSVQEGTQHVSIWNSPVIFARKRSNDLWSKYAGFIRKDIEHNDIHLTPFISDLVGDYDEEKSEGADVDKEDTTQDIPITESELFFPLPWNEEQKRIAERLDANYGVVVKGPPGTGKSHTIANLISRFLAQGKTVLVTSQTSKALNVLRDKLPENIRSLAVSQLNPTANKDDVLQQSIAEISSNLGERHTKYSEEKAEAVRRELGNVREQKALLVQKIRTCILVDSTQEITIDGDRMTPMQAAKSIQTASLSGDFEWFTDTVEVNKELPFSEQELNQLYTLLTEISKDERELYKYELPDITLLPKKEEVLATFALYTEHRAKANLAKEYAQQHSINFSREELSAYSTSLTTARKILHSIDSGYEREIFDLCSLSMSERAQWQAVLEKIYERVQVIRTSESIVLGHVLSGDVDLSENSLRDVMSELKTKVGKATKIGALTKILLSANAKKVLENYRVDGYVVDNEQRIEIVSQRLFAHHAKQEIRTLIEQSFARLQSSPNIATQTLNLVQLEVLISSLRRLVYYTLDFQNLDTLCKKLEANASYSFTKKEDVETLLTIVSSKLATFEVADLELVLKGWFETIQDSIKGENYPVVNQLLQAIQNKDAKAWSSAQSTLSTLFELKKKSIWIHEFTLRLHNNAPNLLASIISKTDQHEVFVCPSNLGAAWKVARLKSWLDSIHKGTSIDELQHELDRLTKRSQQLNGDLVTIMAWQRQIDKVTKKQRDALMAWSSEMKSYGKGKGKFSATHLRAAQEALKEAKYAVPVWIMPLNRVPQMFSEPKSGMFDVVIFDEASQCDIKGLNVGYLGKKLLVVGDPEQISPAGRFQNLEKVYELVSRYLFDIPFKETFSITSSLFALAKIRLSNIIQLNEHFRCVPDIIAFSNHYIYEGKLKPLRYPNPKGLLTPAIVPIFVENGYMNVNNKVNEPEAKRVVEKLVQLLQDPAYQTRPDGSPTTFGIISMLAEDQAKYIEKLIRDLVSKGEISEKVIEERKIECGDAYKFQGDERDVMLLSMVGTPDAQDPKKMVSAAGYTDESVKQRFNVAASRARDQMFLFHSIPLDAFGNKSDWRYKLLSWFYDPQKEAIESGRQALKKEYDSGVASQFSYDVGNLIIDRVYQVLPEYPVIGYRIDLVIQGRESRLAVECDGDQYHTLENFDEDQTREDQLRRAGWEFWRISGSSFYRYKEKALESLWKKLDEMGIKPADQ